MRVGKRALFACVLLALGGSRLFAVEDAGFEKNLLRNGKFAPADAKPGVFPNWAQAPVGWQRKEKPCFKGWPWTLHYLERKCPKTDYYTLQGRLNCAPPDKPGGPARLAFKTADYKGVFEHVDMKRVRIASQRTATGYTLELKIPVKGMKLAGGMVWGMNFVVIDKDVGTPGVVEALNWAGKASYQNPLEFGFVALAP